MKKNPDDNLVEPNELQCSHCNRTFVRETSLQRHICEQKRRWQERDRPSNRIAYNSWIKFYRRFQPNKKKLEYRDFSSSPYYGGFSKFGSYCVDIAVINPLSYVDWLLNENIPLDNWNSDKQYTKYLITYIRTENSIEAINRSLENMLRLAEEQNIQLVDVFRYISPSKLCYMIIAGKISPWILYQSDTGKQWLSKLNDDQRGLIYEYIDPERWQIKFKRSPEEVKSVVSIINEITGL
jgi:hypothetical protein